MKPLIETAGPGVVPTAEADRGQEVVFVTQDLTFSSWRAPYCGPRQKVLPTFRAQRPRLEELCAGLASRAPAGSPVRALELSGPDADGEQEWAAWATVVTSNYNLGD